MRLAVPRDPPRPARAGLCRRLLPIGADRAAYLRSGAIDRRGRSKSCSLRCRAPDRLLRACRRALDASRRLRHEERAGTRTLTATERSIAALTAGAVRVYEEICTLARLNQGRVFPSYDWVAEATGLGRATVARALHSLDNIGFLFRQRRSKRVEGEGPRYRQTSNAYRPILPACVLGYLPRWMRPAPVRDDRMQYDTERQKAQAAMLSTLSCRDLTAVTVGGLLGKALARLGACIDGASTVPDCESQNNPQPLTNLLMPGQEESP